MPSLTFLKLAQGNLSSQICFGHNKSRHVFGLCTLGPQVQRDPSPSPPLFLSRMHWCTDAWEAHTARLAWLPLTNTKTVETFLFFNESFDVQKAF